jgi:penicillin V acylase-like amidase (Ntn superfamily)
MDYSMNVFTRSLIAVVLLFSTAPACTTFLLERGQQRVFGRTYDWHIGYGMVLVNKHGVQKSTMPEPGSTLLEWTSRYGSVTFNQYGREMPSGGMNEAGLVIEVLWLEETEYPAPDSRAAMGCLQWVQYQLDTAENIDQVIANNKSVRIASPAPVHFFLAEKSGRPAVIEFLKGEMVVHRGANLPQQVLTNDTYQNSQNYLRKIRGFGGKQEVPDGTKSLYRFARACTRLVSQPVPNNQSTVDFAFDVIESVSNDATTQWRIVYDMHKQEITFYTVQQRDRKQISFSDLNFSCTDPVRMLDIDSAVSGNISPKMKPYSYDANRKLIDKAFKKTGFLKKISKAQRRQVAGFPDMFTCAP